MSFYIGQLHGNEAVSGLTRACILLRSLQLFFSRISSLAISRRQSLKSLHEHPTSSVLEHLESGPGPQLGHMCWPWAWAVIIAFV